MPIITLILFGCSLYLAVMSFRMKTTGEIPKQLINGKIKLERAKDIPGYIKHMSPRGVVSGVFATVFSAIMLYGEFYPVNTWLSFGAQVGYFAVIIYYGYVSVKAQNKYLF